MQNSYNISTGPDTFSNVEFSTVDEAVAAFSTPYNLQRLERIAGSRLNRLASRPPGQRLRALRDPAEFVNQALELILTKRRKPRARNLISVEAFRNFVQGVMQSLINHELDCVVRQGEHVPFESLQEYTRDDHLFATDSLVREIGLRETKGSLFLRLRKLANDNPALLKAIQLWEESWPLSDRIPKCDLNDKQTHALRIKAREFLKEAAIEDGAMEPTGREPLLP